MSPQLQWLEPHTLRHGDLDARVVTLRHRLQALDWFDDSGLAEIIDQHPRHALSICGMTDRGVAGWTEGRLGDLDGAAIVSAIARGKFWLNVRRIYQHQARFGELVDALYEELAILDPAWNPGWRNATLLISSPTAYVNYHLDVPSNLLWHIRGVKRVWVYPRESEQVVTAEDLAATVAQRRTEMLRFEPSMDGLAEQRDLHPGDFIAWPQHSPHRVDNLEGLNVSLSTEHLTPEGRKRIRVLQANYALKTYLGMPTRATETRGLWPLAKQAAAVGYLAARKLWRSQPQGAAGYPVTFELDPEAADGRRELAASRS